MNRRSFLAAMGCALAAPAVAVKALARGPMTAAEVLIPTMTPCTTLSREYSTMLTMTMDYMHPDIVDQIHKETPVHWFLNRQSAERWVARRNGDFRFFDQKAKARQCD